MWRGGADRRAVDTVLLLLVALWCSALVPRAAPDLAADRAALLALRAAVAPHLPWNASSLASPCGWRGVRCDGTGTRVVGLHLPAAGLAGQLPAGTLGNLTALQTLSLRLNALSGPIPADVAGCAGLRAVYLQGNRFDGEIPEGMFQLQLLRRLDLSGNRVVGGVSPRFNRLTRLEMLYLQDNSLNGTLPADLDLPSLQRFNVSNNAGLTGPVPASLAGSPASAFAGTNLCGGPLSPCPSPPAPPPSPPSPSPPPAPSGPDPDDDGKSSTKLSAGKIAGIAAGSALALLLFITTLFLLCFRWRQRSEANKAPQTAPNDVDTSGSPVTVTVATLEKSGTRRSRSGRNGTKRQLVFVGGEPDAPYDMESLLHASAEVLGKGWLGTTYRATLEGGAAVLAIKRLREAPIPEREFRDGAAALGALRHGNLAPLRAYFYSRDEKLLVYDFVAGRSLCSLLHNNNGGASPGRLDFTERARVALAAARGVAFVHAAGACHGNVKSSNVLVPDDDAVGGGALVTDYGLVQLVAAHVPLRRVTGYRAPEVADPRAVTQEADVYSFGVLLLELLTGRPPANSVPGADDVDLPRWVRTVVQEEWTAEVFDATIAIEERLEQDMVRLLQLATECTERQPDRRPRMDEVAARIEDIVQSVLQKATDMDDDFHSISP